MDTEREGESREDAASVAELEHVGPREAESLIESGAVRLLDVRTPPEFEELGHIPGAALCPVDWIVCAAATLSRDGAPVLVCCEHGIRSVHAGRWLLAAGFPRVINLVGGMAAWTGAREHTPGNPFAPLGPSSWLVATGDLIPRSGRALDVASGRGRHALLLAAVGLEVTAVDRDEEKIAELGDIAGRLGLPVHARVLDLEPVGGPSGEVDLGEGEYDLVAVFNYLHRPLFPALIRALRPGGLLVYETFTIEQAKVGHPRNPHFLLHPGELEKLVEPLVVVRRREGLFDGRHVASVAARAEDAT